RPPPDAERNADAEQEFRLERDYASLSVEAISREDVFPDVSPFACPSCGGALWEAPDDDHLRFRCRIGHAFGAETLLSEQSQSLDASLAAAGRALHERGDLAKRVGGRPRTAGG